MIPYSTDSRLHWLLLATLLLVLPSVRPARADDYTVSGGSSPQQPGDPQAGPGGTDVKPENNASKGLEPVYLHSGEYELAITDVEVPARGIPITIRRTYRSFSAYNSRFGFGWDLNVNMKIREMADGNVVLLDGRNRKHEYGGSI